MVIWWRPDWFQHSGLCHLGAENRRPGEGEDHVGGAEEVFLPLNVVDIVPEQVRGEVQPIAALSVQSWLQSLLKLLLRLLCCLFIYSAITESEEAFSCVDKRQDNRQRPGKTLRGAAGQRCRQCCQQGCRRQNSKFILLRVQIELDLGCTTRTGNPRDCSPRPLFKRCIILFFLFFLQISAFQICLCFQPFNRMDQSLLRKPIYSKLLALYDNYDVSKVIILFIPIQESRSCPRQVDTSRRELLNLFCSIKRNI